MIDIKTLKRQHDGINDVISGLKENIEKEDILESQAFEISKQINLLAGLLKIHLGTEDRYMYPHLLQNGSIKLKETAQHYMEEMGNISNEFVDYKNRFNTRTKIVRDVKRFMIETQKILATLEERIRKEDTNLYSLL